MGDKLCKVEKKMETKRLPDPTHFNFHTNECNLNCPGCYNKSFHQSNKEELSDERLRSITDEAKQLGVSFFVIAGGEPFLRPVLFDIMNQ